MGGGGEVGEEEEKKERGEIRVITVRYMNMSCYSNKLTLLARTSSQLVVVKKALSFTSSDLQEMSPPNENNNYYKTHQC